LHPACQKEDFFVSSRHRAALFLVLITFIAFISLGMPDGLLDIANPRIRHTFDIGPDVFGALFFTGLTGYFLSSFFAGQLVARLGIGKLLAASCLATGLALLGNAAAPAWGWFVVLGLIGGAGAGAIDTGLNTYVATNYGPRLMFWLHASFGLGVTGGTWVMGAVVNSGESWRWGYTLVGIAQIALAVTFFITRARFDTPHPERDESAAQPIAHTPIRATLALPMVWLGVALFFIYTGVEVTAGRWSSSLFIEGRNIKPEVAGLWVSAYWGMFTVGRVAAGFVGRWITPLTFIRLAMSAAVLAAVVLTWNPVSWSGGLALGVMGFAFAPIFPMLISATPGRVGLDHAPNAIGFEISAAAIGGSALAALTGLLAKNFSIEAAPYVLLAGNLSMFALHEIMLRR